MRLSFSSSSAPSGTSTIAAQKSGAAPLYSRQLHAAAALAWEFWHANRRGWMILLSAIPLCAVVFQLVALIAPVSEEARFLATLPMVMSIILAVAFCNFTDRNRRDGIAGFPRHLFVLPVQTRFLVTCAMACSLASVIAVYVVWATVVLRPLDFRLPVLWPATLLASGVVCYQAIIWCLCAYRLTRVVALSFGAATLVGIGFLPTLVSHTSFWATERNVSAMLAATAAFAYGIAMLTVEAQRRGGARGWCGIQALVESTLSAIPRRQIALKSPDAALFWLEWHRAGLLLPAAALLTTLLILGPVLWITGREAKETLWAEMWLALMPMLLAFPIGMGFGKPNFWSLDVTISPFISTRPIMAGQLIAAKSKAAALSTVTAWAIVLLIAAPWIYVTCDTEHWGHLWHSSGALYAPFSRWALPFLTLVGAVVLTWSLLIRSVWLGYSGRPTFYYSVTGVGLAACLTAFFLFIWWLDHPRSHGDTLVGMLPWLPWALAAAVTAKLWLVTCCVRILQRRQLVPRQSVMKYTIVWLACTALLVWYAVLVAPRIEWFRNMMMLAAMLAVPCVSVAVAPLAISWNRHR